MQSSNQFYFPSAVARNPEKVLFTLSEIHTSKDKSHSETWMLSPCNSGPKESNAEKAPVLGRLMGSDGQALAAYWNSQVISAGTLYKVIIWLCIIPTAVDLTCTRFVVHRIYAARMDHETRECFEVSVKALLANLMRGRAGIHC